MKSLLTRVFIGSRAIAVHFCAPDGSRPSMARCREGCAMCDNWAHEKATTVHAHRPGSGRADRPPVQRRRNDRGGRHRLPRDQQGPALQPSDAVACSRQVRVLPRTVGRRPFRGMAEGVRRLPDDAHTGVKGRRAELRALRGRAGPEVRVQPRPLKREAVLREAPHVGHARRVPGRTEGVR